MFSRFRKQILEFIWKGLLKETTAPIKDSNIYWRKLKSVVALSTHSPNERKINVFPNLRAGILFFKKRTSYRRFRCRLIDSPN